MVEVHYKGVEKNKFTALEHCAVRLPHIPTGYSYLLEMVGLRKEEELPICPAVDIIDLMRLQVVRRQNPNFRWTALPFFEI